MNNLGEKIYQLRISKNLSQDQLANMLEVSRQSISKWENSQAVPELDKLVKLSEIFEISLDMLIKNEMPKENKETFTKSYIQKEEVNQTQKIIGFILLGFAGLILIFSLFFNVLLMGILLGIPLILCAIICLKCKRNAGLWCSWILFVLISSFMLWATGVNWLTAFAIFRNGIENMTMQSIVSACQLLILIVLILITAIRFSKQLISYKAHKKEFIISICIYLGYEFIKFIFYNSSLYDSLIQNIETRAWAIQLISTIFNWAQVILIIWNLINLMKLLKSKKSE